MRIVEVGLRDGLQNEAVPIPAEAKVRFAEKLVESGLVEIEAASFVSPKWVPQLADVSEVWPKLPAGGKYSALVPNRKGLDRALELGVKRIAVFTAASDAFTKKNINMTVDESIDAFREVIEVFRAENPVGWIRGYVSTAIACPYGGPIEPAAVAHVVRRLMELGVDEVSIGDTIGVGIPSDVAKLHEQLVDIAHRSFFAWHFHDTRGTAIANTAKALELGYEAFDSSAAGLGGCPYAPGAGGNLATEDLVYFLERNGIDTGVNQLKLAQASLEVLELLGRAPVCKAQLASLSASTGCGL